MVLVRGGITVKPHVQRCADEVVAEFGPGLAPGTYNGHSPPEGPTQALDLFNVESPAGWELQNRVADWLIKNAKRLGVRYVIKWNPVGNDWIWNIERADEGWRAMATRDHRNHVHVTFYEVGGSPIDEPDAPPTKIGESVTDMFTYSTDKRVDQGSIWLVVNGKAHRLHLPQDADRLDKAGVVSLGEMSESFHSLWEHVG